ncbi:PilC/PilY family type IV pilus protein [Syntrophotalea carbinolica]
MGRDHKLYYEAYNDASDLNNDGKLDIRYDPAIEYFGYFDSYKCYEYDGSASPARFDPSSVSADKTCSGSNEWSGDFLNYLTTARIDALRKVLYGGYRSVDTATETVLERSHVPQDAHSWGKEYASVAVDGYDIQDYTPLALPDSGNRHLFGNTTLRADDTIPRLRVLPNSSHRIWEWVSKEQPVLDSSLESSGTSYTGYPASHSAYEDLVNQFATASHLQGSQSVSLIDGSGNPFGSDDYYLTVFKGYLVVSTAGTYSFSVNGDDAVEVLVDGTVVTGWYSGHGASSTVPPSGVGTISLGSGNHKVEFRHQEASGSDSYELWWSGPDSGSSWQIVPAASYSGLIQSVYDVSTSNSVITDYAVRVEVCKSGMLESNCRQYTDASSVDHYKPAGLLQEYGEDDQMLFGLLTGSYTKNTSGGVLRKKMGSFSDEVDAETGQFTSVNGIVKTIDKLRTIGFSTGYTYNQNCGWITTRPINDGECRMWGNPIAEMMYEGVRYFSGKGSPTSAFDIASSGNDDATLGLPLASWDDPFAEGNNEYCAKPFQLIISDINPSYDTGQLPGSYFNSFSGDVSDLDVDSLGQKIWGHEYGSDQKIFIGQSGSVYDGAPTPKAAESFGSVRGLAPEEPTKHGGYYAGSISLFANQNDISDAEEEQKMTTFAVALASPLPQIKIPVGDSTITLVPFAKSVGGYSINATQGSFQPTNSIVDFYVESLSSTSGKFRINFEDVEQGADHDMDAIVEYTYEVIDSDTVKINVESTYAAGSIIQHMGYVISGTTADGTYLEVRDVDTTEASDPDYFLDTPPGGTIGVDWDDDKPLPLTASRSFKVSGNNSAFFLKNPLWYAAKYGNFKDLDENGLPDDGEWDADSDGQPDNYFLVTNALTLTDQLSEAFSEILGMTSSAAAIATNSTRLDTDTLIYQARFESGDWFGQLLAYPVNEDGSVGLPVWDAAELLPLPINRDIYTLNPDVSGTPQGVPFTWTTTTELHTTQQALLNQNGSGAVDGLGKERLNYLRGDQSEEQKYGGPFRNRDSVLGDIVNSDPWFVGTQNYGYGDLPDLEGSTYLSYRESAVYQNRPKMLYVGANDGMLHAFDAGNGEEKFAYVPLGVFPNLSALTDPTYEHQMYVDGSPRATDAYIDISGDSIPEWRTVLVGTLGAGGKSVFALDVTEPDSFTEDNILWEYADTDLGYTIGQAYIVRMANGRWAAVFGNGYNSTNYTAALYIVDLETGALIKKIDTGTGSSAQPNGLATPAPVDYDGDRIVDAIYAGDLHGNMWKFDVSATNINSWVIALKKGSTYMPLFTAKGPSGEIQPITSRPNVGYGPNGNSVEVMVYFGTGQYFEKFDNVVGTNPPVQSFYGIRDSRDNNAQIAETDRSVLVEQSILVELNAFDYDLRVISDYDVVYGSDVKGWYMDMVSPINGAEGERVVDSPLLIGDHLVYTSVVPSGNPCEFGGTGWLYEVDPLTGGRVTYSVFDLDGDDLFDEGDYVTVEIDGKEVKVPVSGKRSQSGIITTPGVISAGTKEYKLSSTSSGTIETTTEKPGDGSFLGRSSWRQIR